jgi:hypothetical protein
MNKFTKRSVRMTLMSFAILATVSSTQFVPNIYVPNVNAQQFPVSLSNFTSPSPLSNLSIANQTGESLVESFGPLSQMEAVIREIENTNATSFAARQQIESVTNNMSNNISNATGIIDSQNMTGDAANDTAMRAVIEQTVNTNATGFAADNLINMTSPQSANS